MKKFHFGFNRKCLFIVLSGVLGTALIVGLLVIVFFPHSHISPRLAQKIEEYAKTKGMTEQEIEKDANLMKQLKMEADQEDKIDSLAKGIDVSNDEMAKYRDMIGHTMDKKKAAFILFNTRKECEDFIVAHGNSEKPADLGIGIVPIMDSDIEGAFYNVAGNEVLEGLFDSMKDGEYTKQPVEFSGMYCYLKRIKISSPIEDDTELVNLIKQEKANEALHKQNQGGEK